MQVYLELTLLFVISSTFLGFRKHILYGSSLPTSMVHQVIIVQILLNRYCTTMQTCTKKMKLNFNVEQKYISYQMLFLIPFVPLTHDYSPLTYFPSCKL